MPFYLGLFLCFDLISVFQMEKEVICSVTQDFWRQKETVVGLRRKTVRKHKVQLHLIIINE